MFFGDEQIQPVEIPLHHRRDVEKDRVETLVEAGAANFFQNKEITPDKRWCPAFRRTQAGDQWISAGYSCFHRTAASADLRKSW